MAKQLVVTDYELEFLKLMGISYEDGTFIDNKTGECLYGMRHDVRSDSGRVIYRRYMYETSYSTSIEIVKHVGKNKKPDLVAVEKHIGGPFTRSMKKFFLHEYQTTSKGQKRIELGIADFVDRIISSINIESDPNLEYFSKIYMIVRDLGVTWRKEDTYYIVNCSLGRMVMEQNNLEVERKSIEHDTEKCGKAVEVTINGKLTYCNLDDFYTKILSLIKKAFEETLSVPAKYREIFEERFNEREKEIEKTFATEVEYAQRKRKERLDQLREIRNLLPIPEEEEKGYQKDKTNKPTQ